MASNQYLTLKDITSLDSLADPASVGLVDNIVNVAPEVERITGRPIPGISYPATIMTAIGSNAAFRKVNSGVPLSAFSIDTKRFSCFYFDCQMSVDEAQLSAQARESGEEPAFVFTTFATAAMRQKALYLGRQFYLGSVNDPNGFPGLMDFLATQQTQVDSRTGKYIAQCLDAGGNINGGCEAVWFVKQGPQGVHFLWGGGRGIYMNPWIPLNVGSPDSTAGSPKQSRQWRANAAGWIGTSMAQYHALGAIMNVTPGGAQTSSNGFISVANGFTDALAAEMWALWPITMKPDLCLCTQNAAYSLQLSRTVTNFVEGAGRQWTGGATSIANFPTHLPTCGNIPVVVTDSIVPSNRLTAFPSGQAINFSSIA